MITGANKGIGFAIAKAFYDQGALLSLGIRDVVNFNNPFDEKRCLLVKVDVSVEQELKAYYEATIERFKTVDILINNAGIDKPCPLIEITSEYLNDMMNVNFNSMVLLSKYVALNMIKNKSGRIINISSIAGKEGTPHHIAYTASKHAVIGFTKSAARELIRHDIYVNAICPGLIKTDMLTNFFSEYANQIGGNKEEEFTQMVNKTPRGVIGQPDDVAHLVLFLTSEKSKNIIGQAINTDGGFLQW